MNNKIKSIVSVSAMAEMCSLSRSRFYDLMNAGVFPEPVRKTSSKRPVYNRELIEKCLEIRRTGIGDNGEPVLFNRKLSKKKTIKKNQKSISISDEYDSLVESLKSLGLSTTKHDVAKAIFSLFPDGGWKSRDQGEVIRAIFLHLQKT